MITNAVTSNSGANTNLSSAIDNQSNQPDQRDMFMTLLVAQLKNHDPLQPQDGTEFVAQLAQFNSLDNLIGIRQSIEQLTYYMQQAQTQNTPTDPKA